MRKIKKVPLFSKKKFRIVRILLILQIRSIKFLSRRRPTAPLFSGWNWTPYTLSRIMDEANGMIYSVVVSVYSGVVSAWSEWTKYTYLSRGEPGKERVVFLGEPYRIPAHMGDFYSRDMREPAHAARDKAKTLVRPVLFA